MSLDALDVLIPDEKLLALLVLHTTGYHPGPVTPPSADRASFRPIVASIFCKTDIAYSSWFSGFDPNFLDSPSQAAKKLETVILRSNTSEQISRNRDVTQVFEKKTMMIKCSLFDRRMKEREKRKETGMETKGRRRESERE